MLIVHYNLDCRFFVRVCFSSQINLIEATAILNTLVNLTFVQKMHTNYTCIFEASIFLIAFSWSFSTVALIYYESNLTLNPNVVLSIISRMFFIIAITIPFDIRDVEYDKKKTYTIPMLVGDKMAKKIAVFFLLLFLIIDSYLYLNNLNFGFFISTILCFLYSFYIVCKDNKKKDGLYYSFWLESCSISLLFFLILTSIFL